MPPVERVSSAMKSKVLPMRVLFSTTSQIMATGSSILQTHVDLLKRLFLFKLLSYEAILTSNRSIENVIRNDNELHAGMHAVSQRKDAGRVPQTYQRLTELILTRWFA